MLAEIAPAMKATVEPTLFIGEIILRVFTSAFVDARVQLAIPELFVALQVP